MRSSMLLALVLLFSQRALSDTLVPQNLDSLFAHADFVGIVRIDAGYFYPHKGSIYSATVQTRLKGDSASIIFFGPFAGGEIGSKYLVFLVNAKETLADHWSRPFHHDGPPIEYLSRAIIRFSGQADSITNQNTASPQLPGLFPANATYYAIMFEGFGEMPLGHIYHTYLPMSLHLEEAVKVSTSHVLLPKTLTTYPVDDSKEMVSHDNLFNMRWVMLNELVSYLAQK